MMSVESVTLTSPTSEELLSTEEHFDEESSPLASHSPDGKHVLGFFYFDEIVFQ